MLKIVCLATTPKHREIAEKLGESVTTVTNLASVYLTRNPQSSGATLEDIRALLKERETSSKEAYLALPLYNKEDTVKDGKPLAHTKRETGEIYLSKLPKDNPMGYFFDYILGNQDNNPTSQQKKAVFDMLIKQGELKNLDELREILSNPFEAYQFLLWHEMSHKLNDDGSLYWNNGTDLMTADKLNIEYRATLDALNKAKEYRKLNPINNRLNKTNSINISSISTKTLNFGVLIDPNLISNYKVWLQNNPNGIVAYRVNKLNFNTPQAVNEGIIGNPFDWQKYGAEIATLMFTNWLITGNNYNEALATEEFRLAILNKIKTTQTSNILYYKELGRPSHATILGYLINHKELLQNKNNNTLNSSVTFTTSSSSSYPARTRENAEWSDITLALATNFNTAGEKLTKRAAGNKYLGILLLEGTESNKKEIIASLEAIDEFINRAKAIGRPIKLNIAGNGIYSFTSSEQEDVNRLLENIIRLAVDAGVLIETVRSGGQTGIDEAGVVAAQRLNIPAEVHATSNWMFRDKSGKDISDEKAFKDRFGINTSTNQEDLNKAQLIIETNKEVIDTLGGDKLAESEVKDAVKVAKKGMSFEEALAGVQSVFTKEEIELIKSTLNGKNLQVMSVSRLTDPAFFSKQIISFLEENSKKALTDPTRINVVEIWSKHDGLPIQDILDACKKYKVAPMVSFSITGLGGTAIELGVMKYNDMLDKIEALIKAKALNPATTTIRIDPILVGETKIEDIKNIVARAKAMGIKKFVTSLVQSYGYTEGTARDRKVVSGINNALAKENRTYDWDKYYGRDRNGKINFKPKQEYIDEIGKVLNELDKDPEITILTCAFHIDGLKTSACLDPLIIERITGVDVTRKDGTYDRDTSRPECMCYGAHSDMFRFNEKTCASSCAYCYAAHSGDNNLNYYNEDGTLKDNAFTLVRPLSSIESITSPKTNTEKQSLTALLSNNNLRNQLLEELRQLVLQERQERLQSVDNVPNSGVKGVLINEEDQLTKLNSLFTPRQRLDRIKLISRMFSDEVSTAVEQLKYALQDKLEQQKAVVEQEMPKAVEEGDWIKLKNLADSITAIEKQLLDLEDPIKGRHAAIEHFTVGAIINNMKLQLQEMKEYSTSEYVKLQYLNIIDNFKYFMDLASFSIELNESLKMDLFELNSDDVSKDPVINGIIQDLDNTLDDTDREVDDDDENGDRVIGNEGWSFKVRLVDPHKSLSKTTKRILSNLIKLDNITGEPEMDDLGNIKYINERFAHAFLLNKLSDMIDDSDFCKKETDEEGNITYTFPALEKLASKYKWVLQVINELTNSPQEVSAFYSDFRKDFIPYWKSKEITLIDPKTGKETKIIQSIPLNLETGYENAKGQIIDNYSSGELVDKDLIYNNSSLIIEENLNKGRLILNNLNLQEIEDEDEMEEASEVLSKATRMLGLDVTKQDILNLWDTTDGQKDIKTLYNTLNLIYDTIAKSYKKANFHLIAECESDFNTIARLLGEVTETDSLGSFRNGDKMYQSFSAPNYISTLIKSLKSDTKREEYLLKEFKEFSWFFDKAKGKWKGSTEDKACWLELFETDDSVRSHLKIRNLLSISYETELGTIDDDYTKWTPGKIVERFISEYFSIGGKEGNKGSKKLFAYYNFPIFSDSPIAMMLCAPRYIDNVEEEIIPRLRQVVKQELERIKLVEERAKKGVSTIACFDGDRGRSFCFFPGLGTYNSKTGKYTSQYVFLSESGQEVSFRDKVAELKETGGMAAVNEFIDSTLRQYMNDAYESFISNNSFMKDKLIALKLANTSEEAEEKLKEFFYNHHYATTLIIQLTTTDLAYYKDGTDFLKRYKEVYAAGTKLNTLSEYGREFEKTLYLSDDVITSRNFSNIKRALQQAKKRWVKAGMSEEVADMNIDSILDKFKNITDSDALAYRSASSFRAVLDMLGLWDDNMAKSFERMQNGEWDMADFNIVWQTIKPFVYTQIPKDNGIDGGKIKVAHQNKNSEFLLLAMHSMVASSLGASPQLVAINKFMEENDIDVVQFESAVKSGKQGCVDISYSESRLQDWINNNQEAWQEIRKAYAKEKGQLKLNKASNKDIFKVGNDYLLNEDSINLDTYNERMDAIAPKDSKEVFLVLDNLTKTDTGELNNDVIHTIPYRDYMIALPTPEHLFDKNGTKSKTVFGSLFRNLIVADIAPDAIITVNGKDYNKELLLNLYNSLIVENLLEDYKRIKKRFSDIETFLKALIDTIRGNEKYGKNVLDALQLIDWTDPNTGETKKIFNIPLYSPAIARQILEVVNAMFKNAVAKQKIKGSNCVLVSNFGFTDRLNLKFKEDGNKESGIEYAECYLPWYSKDFFTPFLKNKVDERGNQYQEIDINKIPKDLLEFVGYRIPTEDKYSMLTLRVKGFLPLQNGNSIMLPADVTQMAGSDFDVDKLYIMMPEYEVVEYDIKKAKRDFNRTHKIADSLLSLFLTSDEGLEEAPETFKEWLNKHEEEYKLQEPRIRKIRYNSSKEARQQSRAARNNMLIDISKGILLHSDTAEKLLNPGSFDTLKKAERLATIMGDIQLLRAYANERGIDIKYIEAKANNEEYISNPEQFNTTLEQQEEAEKLRKALKEEVKVVRESLKKESLDSLNDFLSEYRKERDPLSLDTFVYNHQLNMTGGTLIGIYANNTTMQAKFQNSGLRLKNYRDANTGRLIDYTFTIDGYDIDRLDSVTSQWGERISKNCAEFSAASVDNVKDPVLAGLLQNKDTANIACFMLRAGIPINIIGLLFTQPAIRDCIKTIGKLDSDHLPDVKINGHISITTDELIDNIISNDYESNSALRAVLLMLNIARAASDLNEITNMSRADSPNGAISISLGAARNLVLKVENLVKKSDRSNFTITGVKEAIAINNVTTSDDSIDIMREKLMEATIPRLQAFYSLGIELPLQVMSKFFIQLNSNLDNLLSHFLEQAPNGIMNDAMVETFYRDYIEYMLTGSTLFGDDNEKTYNEKRDHYLYEFPKEFISKRQDPTFKEYTILKKLSVTDGVIELKRSGKLSEDIREAYTLDFDNMITSNNPEVVQLAKDLFMYSFYKNGYSFGPNSFGNFFSPMFLLSFPEFMSTLRDIETKVGVMDMTNFGLLFLNNYWDKITREIKNSKNRSDSKIMKVDTSDPNSDIIVPTILCKNNMSEDGVTPYLYVRYEGNLYLLSTMSSTNCTYSKSLVVTDNLGRKYNMSETVYDMLETKTDLDLITANKLLGAKKISMREMEADLEALIALMEAIESFAEDYGEMFGNTFDEEKYDLSKSIEQLENPLCN